jgi:hypothetical protein
MDRAEAMLQEAERLLTSVGAPVSEDLMYGWARAILALYMGNEAEGMAALERALVVARRQQDRWAECDCLIRMAQIEIDADRPSAALARCRELAPVAAKMGEGSQQPVADALDAVARMAACVPGAPEHVAKALARLRDVDAKGMLSYVLIAAAELDLRARRLDRARAGAEEGLRAAEAVGRRSQAALARAVLARVALAEGDVRAATGHLDELRSEMEPPLGLSARARDELRRARQAVRAFQETTREEIPCPD